MSPPGGGRAGFNKGPQLPWLLQQQLGQNTTSAKGDTASVRAGNHGLGFGPGPKRPSGFSKSAHSRKPASRKEQRRAARQEKKHQKFEVQQQQAQRRHQQQTKAGSKRPIQALDAGHVAAAAVVAGVDAQRKKQKRMPEPQEQQQQQRAQTPVSAQQTTSKRGGSSSSKMDKGAAVGVHSSRKTKFFDMLAADGVVTAAAAPSGAASQSAFLADLKLQREMARKLKVKKGKTSGPKDGLDAFLSGITAGADQPPAITDDQEDHTDHDLSSDDIDFGEHEDESDESDDDESGFSDSEDDEHLDRGLPGFGSSDDEGEEHDLQSDDDDLMNGGGRQGGSSSGSDGESAEGEEMSDDAAAAAAADPSDHDGSSSSEEPEKQSDFGSGPDHDDHDDQAQAAVSVPGNSKQDAPTSSAKYVPPHLRKAQAASAGAGAAALAPAVQRKITGLLNRLAESNLQPICRDILALYESEGRRAVADCVSSGLLAAVAEGPRATEQFACVAAVFVAGLTAGARAQDISARFLEMLVARMQQAYASDDGLACHNLIMLLAYCYSTGLVAADCMYSVLGELTRRFTESDVAMMLTLLNAVGLQLRSADPSAMKDFVLAVHDRAAAAGPGGMSKRAEIMLELVMDIKNNRTREMKAARAAAAAAAANKKGGGAASGRGGASAVVQPGLLKWLKQSGIDDVTLANISWAKLVQTDKKGMWWHPAATDAAAGLLPGLIAEHSHSTAAAAAAADPDDALAGGLGGGDGAVVGAGQLLQLAAGLRLTTDARRAVFVAIMGSDDCAEASEKLLRLPLKGDQSRDIIRVLLECCLQESRYNPYYGHLAARLTAVSKAHKVTLQYALWDQWKDLSSSEPRRLLCLAGLVGHCLASFVLPLSVLKVIDFDACGTWTNKETFLWRHTMQQLLSRFKADSDNVAAFNRLAQQQAHGALSKSLGLFLKMKVGPWLVAQGDAGVLKQDVVDVCLQRLMFAEKVLLSSTAAVLAG